MRGLKPGHDESRLILISYVARSAPPMRGLKRRISRTGNGSGLPVARSAPPMRGLKHQELPPNRKRRASCRAIRPAYEGIETRPRQDVPAKYPLRRAIRPAYEGIETHNTRLEVSDRFWVARSAPPMRGLKQARCPVLVAQDSFGSRDPPRL